MQGGEDEKRLQQHQQRRQQHQLQLQQLQQQHLRQQQELREAQQAKACLGRHGEPLLNRYQTLHGTAIFAYIDPQNLPNVGKYYGIITVYNMECLGIGLV